MRYLKLSALLILSGCYLAGCAALTPRLDDLTGTTIGERCVDYRGSVAALDLARASRDLTDSEQSRRNIYQAFIDEKCPPVE